MSVTTPELTVCKSCGAPIFFLFHVTKNSRMPINATPDQSGNIVLEGTKCYRITNEPRRFGEIRYRSHFSTCPRAEQWRGR